MKRKDIPEFGPLSGVKVLLVGASVAGPQAISYMADFGADVIWIENPKNPDILRQDPKASMFDLGRKNMRNLVMNTRSPEGREALLKIIADVDILLETSRGGQWERWGLGDDVLWQVNPKLVITHVSGYGQFGDPAYFSRPGFDPAAQAFSGYMLFTGQAAPNPPSAAVPYTADYMTAAHACWASLAAYIKAQKTGIGESIDMAQFEVMLNAQSWIQDCINYDLQITRGGKGPTVGIGNYPCTNGYIAVVFAGAHAMKEGLELIGLKDDPDYAGKQSCQWGSPGDKKLDEAIINFCATHTVEECEKLFNAAGVASTPILTPDKMLTHPHYIAREVFMEWESKGKKYIGTRPLPRMKNNPGQVWRGAPALGLDNDDILEEYGYTAEQIAAMYEQGILRKA